MSNVHDFVLAYASSAFTQISVDKNCLPDEGSDQVSVCLILRCIFRVIGIFSKNLLLLWWLDISSFVVSCWTDRYQTKKIDEVIHSEHPSATKAQSILSRPKRQNLRASSKFWCPNPHKLRASFWYPKPHKLRASYLYDPNHKSPEQFF